MGKSRVPKFIFVIFAVVFIAAGVGCGFFTKEYYDNKYIVENGVVAFADVYDYGYSEDDDGYRTYFLKYEFTNAITGERQSGRTSTTYAYSHVIYYYTNSEPLAVFYLEDGRSIEYDYLDFNSATGTLIGCIICSAVGWGFAVALVIMLIRGKRHKSIERYGFEAEGTYLSSATKLSVNDVPYYNITYYWTGPTGKYIEETTPCNYTYSEAMAFHEMGKFKIKYVGEKSIIPKNVGFTPVTIKQAKSIKHKDAKCEYCGSLIDASQKQCPGCGSKR